MTDRARILQVLTGEWVTTTGVQIELRRLGSNAKHPRVSFLLHKLLAAGLVERRVEDGDSGYRRKSWRLAE